MTLIPTPQKQGKKIKGEFYPLQEAELRAMYANKVINNMAYVHLALRSENPFCDRPVQIIPKEFALKWGIPESSVYKVIGRLKELGVILIKSGKIFIEWVKEKLSDSINNPQPDPAIDYQFQQTIINFDNPLPNPIINYQFQQNQGLQPLFSMGFEIPQTFINKSDLFHISSEEKKINANFSFSFQEEDNKQFNLSNETSTEEINEIKLIAESIISENDEISSGCSTEENNSIQSQVNQEDKKDDVILQHPVIKGKEFKRQDLNYQQIRKDEGLIHWLAAQWAVEFGGKLKKNKTKVRNHFINHPEKCMNYWEEYQAELKERKHNNQLLMRNNVELKDDSVMTLENEEGRVIQLKNFNGSYKEMLEEKKNITYSEETKSKWNKLGDILRAKAGKGFGGKNNG